jgi:hypothetical protein
MSTRNTAEPDIKPRSCKYNVSRLQGRQVVWPLTEWRSLIAAQLD